MPRCSGLDAATTATDGLRIGDKNSPEMWFGLATGMRTVAAASSIDREGTHSG